VINSNKNYNALIQSNFIKSKIKIILNL
jgi:hypothetical protein